MRIFKFIKDVCDEDLIEGEVYAGFEASKAYARKYGYDLMVEFDDDGVLKSVFNLNIL
jgi:hypothetical protein